MLFASHLATPRRIFFLFSYIFYKIMQSRRIHAGCMVRMVTSMYHTFLDDHHCDARDVLTIGRASITSVSRSAAAIRQWLAAAALYYIVLS
jgi:hypothetical protein